MKKILLTLVIAISTMTSFASPTDVNPTVLSAFNKEFKAATEVEWSAGINYFRATFTLNDKHIFAYYSESGELLGLSRYVTVAELPLNLQSDLRKSYGNYWISDLFEVANSDGTCYYATVENADTKIVLKATDAKNWTNFRKTKKS
jgi:hypothetical protein